MSNFVQIQRIPYEEPYNLELHWKISGEDTTSFFELYDNADILSKFAQALLNFPKSSGDKYTYQLGSEKVSDKTAYFFKVEFFMRNSRGHDAAIDIKFVNHQQYANTRIVDYSLYTNSSRIRQLGKLFSEFSTLDPEILYWSEHDEFIGSLKDFELGNWRI